MPNKPRDAELARAGNDGPEYVDLDLAAVDAASQLAATQLASMADKLERTNRLARQAFEALEELARNQGRTDIP